MQSNHPYWTRVFSGVWFAVICSLLNPFPIMGFFQLGILPIFIAGFIIDPAYRYYTDTPRGPYWPLRCGARHGAVVGLVTIGTLLGLVVIAASVLFFSPELVSKFAFVLRGEILLTLVTFVGISMAAGITLAYALSSIGAPSK